MSSTQENGTGGIHPWLIVAPQSSVKTPVGSSCKWRPRAEAGMPPKRAGRFARASARGRCKRKSATHARLDVFTRGMIWGMHLAGMSRDDMQKFVVKKDGSNVPLKTIDKVVASKKANPKWTGQDAGGPGRQRKLSDADLKALVDLVFRERGRAKVTIAYCRKMLPRLKKVHRTTLGRCLHAAGFQWLVRRRKSWVPPEHKEARMAFARSVLRKHGSSLSRWAYTDGTSFYLARGPSDHGQKKRAALGRYVWRRASGNEGLFDDNIGPSLYAKAQGLPVKIWGFLANGRLEHWVLPADPKRPRSKTTNMNGRRYLGLVESKFKEWRLACFSQDAPCALVQDHEKCLWQASNLAAMREAGCAVIQDFPKLSPDLNAIEGAWHLLRQRLEQTEPDEIEGRAEFLARLRRTVHWLNERQAEALREMCSNQKKRAADVLEMNGAKTKW